MNFVSTPSMRGAVSNTVQRTIVLRFNEQCVRTPDAIALVFAEQELSYRELDDWVNQLAHHLQSLGVGTETLVGVFMNRSPGMVVALLAILRAGGAYVPLDPAYPTERITLVIEDSQASVVITTDSDRVEVWAEALGVANIDRDENIFDLGATSLMMPEVQSELRRRLDREISLVDLFEFHTVRSLAAHLADSVGAPSVSNRAQRRLAARVRQGSA